MDGEKKNPKYHEFYYRLGRLFYKQNLAKKAQLYLLKAFRLDGENGNYAFALGENYLLEGNTRAARKFFDEQLLQPQLVQSWRNAHSRD